MKSGTVKLVVAGLLAGLASSVMAQDPPAVPAAELSVETQVVRFDDLDLRKPAGAATLHWRLRMAANEVCRESNRESLDLRAARREKHCRESALEGAMAQLQIATVKAQHDAWLAAGSNWLARPRPTSYTQAVAQR